MSTTMTEELQLLIETTVTPKGRDELKKLREELKATQTEAGKIGQVMGTNLAPALDNLARSGTSSAAGMGKLRSSLAQMTTQAIGMRGPLGNISSSLLLFSAGSATVLGIVAGIALIAKAYEDLKKPIEEAQEAADKAQLRLTGALRGQDQDANPVRFAQQQLDAAEAEQRRLQDRIAATSKVGKLLPGFAEDEANLAAVTADVATLRVELEQATDAATKAGAKINEAFDEKTAARAKVLATATESFKRQLEDLGNAGTTTVLDDLATAMQRLREQAEQLGVAGPKLDAALKVFEDKIDVAKVTEGIGAVENLQTIEELQAALEQLRDLRERGLDVTDLTNKLLERQKVLTGEIADNVARQQDEATTFTGGMETAVDSSATVVDNLQAQADTAVTVARGVLGIAQAFGLADQQSAATLQNVLSIVDSLPGALSGNPADILGVVGGFLGAISSLFGGGTSPEELARRKVLEDNTAALERVRDGLENLGGGLTGTQQGTASRIAQRSVNLLNNPGNLNLDNQVLSVAQAQQAFGLTARELRDLQAVADAFGITLNGTKKSWEDLDAAIASSQGRAFLDSFAGRLQSANLRNDLFDVTGAPALQNIAKVAAQQSGKGGVLAGLDKFDLSTVAGRGGAESFLQGVYEKANAGLLTATDKGNLSLEDILQILQTIEGGIDGLNQGSPTSPQNQSFTISRSITEVTGDRLGSLLATAADYGRRTAEATELIAALMLNGSSLVPAAVGAAGGGSGSGSGGISTAQLDRSLGDRARSAALRAGNTTVS